MIEVRGVGSLSGVDSAFWNGIVGGGSFYLTHQWLAAQDSGQPVSPRYYLAYRHGELVGVLPTYVVEQESHKAYRPECLVAGRWQGRYVLAGSRRAYANDILAARRLPAREWRAVGRALIDAALDRVEEAGADGALFLYLGTTGAEAVTDLCPGTVPLLTSAQAVIDLPGDSFDDYLRAFPPKRRREFRREMARFASAGYRISIGPARDHWERLAELFVNLQRRHGQSGRRETWRAVVERQAARLDEHALIFLCRAGDSLVGAALSYPWQRVLYQKLVGFDYEWVGSAFEYFNLVYYAPLRYAYQHGMTSVHLGPTAIDAKLRRGARLAPLWSVAVTRDVLRSDEDSAYAYNAAEAQRWRTAYSWCDRAFGDHGWRQWGAGQATKGEFDEGCGC